MARIAYPSDLTDAQWRLIEKRIPAVKPGGRPRSVNIREVVNGILYLVRTGCSWRQLPHDFPPWGTVHYYYRALPDQRRLAEDSCCSPRQDTDGRRPRGFTFGGDHRQPERENHRRRGATGTTRARRSTAANAM